MLGYLREMICPVSGSNPAGAVAVSQLAHVQEMGLSEFHPQREIPHVPFRPFLIARGGTTEKSESVMINTVADLQYR